MVPAILHALPPFPKDGVVHIERRKIGSSSVATQPFGFVPANSRAYDITQSIPPSMLRNWQSASSGSSSRRAQSVASFVNMVLNSGGGRTLADGTRLVNRDTTEDVILRWLHHLPQGYERGGKWPLVVYLHDLSDRGYDLNLLRRNGPFARKAGSLPFIVLAPQCSERSTWQTEDLRILMKQALKRYRVDTSRVFIGGTGIGATAAWRLANAEPRRFKAIVTPGVMPMPQDRRRVRNIRRYEGTEPDPWQEEGVVEFLKR